MCDYVCVIIYVNIHDQWIIQWYSMHIYTLPVPNHLDPQGSCCWKTLWLRVNHLHTIQQWPRQMLPLQTVLSR